MFTFRARAVIVQMTKDIVSCSLSVCTQLFHHLRKTKAVAKGWPFARFGCYGNSSPKITCSLGFVHTRFPLVHSYCTVGIHDKGYSLMFTFRARAVIPLSAEDKAVAKGWPFARFGCYGNSSHKITCSLGFVHMRFPLVHSYCTVGIDNKGCSFMFTFRARAVIAQMTKDVVSCSLSVCTQLFHHLQKTRRLQKAGLLQGLVATATPPTQLRARCILSTLAFRACTVIALSVYMTKDIVSCSHSERAQLLHGSRYSFTLIVRVRAVIPPSAEDEGGCKRLAFCKVWLQ
jgi:hypothetical protein